MTNIMLDNERTAAFPSLPAPPEKIPHVRQLASHCETSRPSVGDIAIDWQGATPNWGAIFFGIIIPIVGVLVAAIVVALYLI